MAETLTTPAGIPFVRTPEDRFEGLDDFPYEPRSVDIDGLRMAYIDEGPADAHPLLLLHGEPTWGYLYRRMIPPLVAAGFRCVVPDLIGFGRSDKPTDQSAYTYNGHVDWMKKFVATIDLPSATLFCQDWGGLIGLRVAAELPDRFARVAMGNTGLPIGENIGEGFDFWLAFSQKMDFTQTSRMLQRATTARELSDHELAAYDAPFPEAAHTAGAVVFPTLVPITPDHGGVAENMAAWKVWDAWEKPLLTLWGIDDPVLGTLHREFLDRVPGAAGQPHQEFQPAGHFVQDDRGEDIAAALIDWIAS